MVVSHDAFARAGLARESAGPGCCDWCGQSRSRRYRYTVETDGGRRPVLGQPIGTGRAFCNLECFKAFAS